jgi:peptidoglycan/LPS O-acetylase OafA/YrhL
MMVDISSHPLQHRPLHETMLLRILHSLRPKSILYFLLGLADDGREHKVTPTAWLDGLRGYASLFVSLYHLRIGFTDDVHRGFGARPEDKSLFELPLMRILFAGQAMVAVFYIVSGFSLAWGPLKDLRDGEPEKSLNRLRSSIVRRYFRLYIPVLASTLIVLVATSLGLYQFGIENDPRTAYKDPIPERFPGLFPQISNWLSETWIFLNVLTGSDRHSYYVHSWYEDHTGDLS